MSRSGRVVVAVAALWVAVACGNAGSGGSSQGSASKPAEGAAPAAAPAAQAAAQGQPGLPFNINTLFPPGAGHDLTLSTCGTCHPVACVARGQRTMESWAAIKEGHKDKLSNMSGADQDAVFAYLRENFNNTKPEPKIPPEAIQQGCTPF